MSSSRQKEINIFGPSFVDVLANAVGGLAFLLVMATTMISNLVFSPPRVQTEQLPEGYHDMAYETWISAREGLGDFHWRFGKGERPAGLEIDPVSGKLYGRLRLADDQGESATFEFEVICESRGTEAEDQPREDSRQFTLQVMREAPGRVAPLEIRSRESLPACFTETTYPLALSAWGGVPPYHWTLKGTLPVGLTFHPDGHFEGIAKEAGEFRFGGTVQDARGLTVEQAFRLDVAEKPVPPPPLPPMTIQTRALGTAVASEAYRLYPAAEGGQPPYRWRLVSAPRWLGVTPDGKSIEGQPGVEDVGHSMVVLEVADSTGRTVCGESLACNVVPPPAPMPPPLRLKTESLASCRLGTPLEIAWAAEGGFAPYRWSDPTPQATATAGLALDVQKGTTKGVPTKLGIHPLRIKVVDARDTMIERSLELSVEPPLQPLRITTSRLPVGRVGSDYELAFASEGGYPPYRWTLVAGALPPGLALSESPGRLSGKPTAAGRFEPAFQLCDASGCAAADPLLAPLEVMTAKDVPLLVVKTTSLPLLVVGSETRIALSCEGGAPPYAWTSSSPLPEGIRIKGDNLEGRPLRPSLQPLALRVEDSLGHQAVATVPLDARRLVPWWLLALLAAAAVLLAAMLWLTLGRANRLKPQPLSILTESVPNARASHPYAVHLASAGGTPPYRWRIVEGLPPPGLELNEEGLLQGVPLMNIPLRESRKFNFVVEVQDNRGKTSRREL